jgi:predicted lipid-binding transport protein (Tim44 family)
MNVAVMKKLTPIVFGALIAVALVLAGSGDAFAARLGGGKSFGSRPSYSEPYRRTPNVTQPGLSQPGTGVQQPAYTAAQQRNQAVRDSLAQRGGFMRMLGGLALGGLLGALLFGGGFEHINFFDILIFGVIAFMLFKLFAARRRAAEGVSAPAGYSPEADRLDRPQARQAEAPPSGAGFNTDVLFGKGRSVRADDSVGISDRINPSIPADFEVSAFLTGAKAAYTMMQKAWDQGDVAELRALTTDKVFGELQDQIRARGGAVNRTDLLEVGAELLEVRDVGSDREAAVLFDVLLRESPEVQPARVREVWHFVRSRNSRQPTWFLDGIQQVED